MNERLRVSIVKTALQFMGHDVDSLGPLPLADTLIDTAGRFGASLDRTDADSIVAGMIGGDVNGGPRRVFTEFLHRWDYCEAPWTHETARNTLSRRARIYDALELNDGQRRSCDMLIPVRTIGNEPAIIAEEHIEWYTPERRAERSFFWEAYAAYLRDAEHWDPQAIDDLNRACDAVVTCLSDPVRPEAYQSKGLVVGYVQSGKTSNFIGVISKAADAGYRLIIVLAGTLDLLRNQTQRRIDKQLIGQELIMAGTAYGERHDYAEDHEWSRFIRYGRLPSELEAFDWHRLTAAKDDYRSLHRGLLALEFERSDPGRKVNDPVNLHRTRARLVVVKKHSTVLGKLIRDLRGLTHTPLADVPALIIDDESDQASINTLAPDRAARGERTSTNKKIVELLRILPRAQYVGYTATPFANVFVSPDDAADLFPRDYIVSLRKPNGYMGTSDFFDVDEEGVGPNERRFVRDIRGDDIADANLPKALAMFVLSGAIKLFREKYLEVSFRHHTMLVHRSHRMGEHENDAELVRRVFSAANYSTPEGLRRLEAMFNEEYAPLTVSSDQLQDPHAWSDLVPFIHECLRRLEDEPVGIVNGDQRYARLAPDFDKFPVWRILVGGTKLSRGYTVEGLTISYYRRKAKNADTMMQMGRWFGFRKGYGDLVRLFLGREEPDGQRTFDLLDAFKSICRDEEEFRSQLDRYSRTGEQRITPREVPPLVPSHMLRPTATNKMYNAELRARNFGGEQFQSTMAPTTRSDYTSNDRQMRALVNSTHLSTGDLMLHDDDGARPVQFRAIWGDLHCERVTSFLESYRTSRSRVLSPVIEFLQGAMGDPEIERWLLLAPQTVSGTKEKWELSTQWKFDVVHRARVQVEPHRFKVYSEPEHVVVAKYLAGLWNPRRVSVDTRKLARGGQGVLMFYPCWDKKRDDFVSMGFALIFPQNGIERRLYFSVKDPSRQDAIVVDKE